MESKANKRPLIAVGIFFGAITIVAAGMVPVKADKASLKAFEVMKAKGQTAYIIFKIKGSQIVVDKSVPKKKAAKDYILSFIKDMKASGAPRYAVLDWNKKLLFVLWNPENAKALYKMRYATARESFRQELGGLKLKMQATDDGEMSKKMILQKLK